MQKIVIEVPYRFIPPYRGKLWGELFRPVLPYYLHASHKIVDVQCRGLDRLRGSIQEGKGILLAPNHCRLSDPMTMGWIVREAGIHLYTMASWHLFNQESHLDRLSAWMMRRLGAFSILREGTDRAALTAAIDILATAERPLVVFPEGVVSRTNDRLGPLMEGISFMARMAAKKAAKLNRPGVVIHPTTLRYVLLDPVEPAVTPFVEKLERRLTWRSEQSRPLLERVTRLNSALLVLKEQEYLGEARTGSLEERKSHLIEHLLEPLEREWLTGPAADKHPISRVKEIRTAILPRLLDQTVSEEMKTELRRKLQVAYVAQQLHLQALDYLRPDSPPEHLLETVERIEEDLTDVTSNYGRLRVILDIGEPIPVTTDRDKRAEAKGAGDPLLDTLSARLATMLEHSAEEVSQSRNGGDHAVIEREVAHVAGA